MSAARQVLVESDDLERLLELAAAKRRLTAYAIEKLEAAYHALGALDFDLSGGEDLVAAGANDDDLRLIDRVRRDSLGR